MSRAYEVDPKPALRLTEREAEVLTVIAANGYSYWEAARALGLSFGTINNHMTNLRHRMGVRTTMQALYLAMSQGLIQ